MRVRIRRFHCAVWDPFTICSWFYWWLILEFNDVFPRVSEEMIFEKYELKPYVLCFSLQYWTPCLSSLLGLFGSFCCYLMVLFREWSSRCFLDLLLVPITVASKSFCWYLIVLFREWSCWWFLDILLIHIIVASEILVFPKLKLRKVCLCLNMVILVCFFFGVVLVSVDDAFWSVFTIFDANLTHLIYQEWDTGSFLCAFWSPSFSGNTGSAYCRWRCCFACFVNYRAPCLLATLRSVGLFRWYL